MLVTVVLEVLGHWVFKVSAMFKPGARMDYSLIELLVGIVTIVGFMYKFERDTRSELKAELRTNIEELRSEMRKEVEELRSELRREVGALRGVIDGVGEVIVEYFRLRGIISQGDADLLRIAIKRLVSTAANPLTEAERRRLLELVDKDDLTIEEAEELYRLARKLYEEYIDKTPDAFKALLYAVIKRTEAYMKYGKQASTSS